MVRPDCGTIRPNENGQMIVPGQTHEHAKGSIHNLALMRRIAIPDNNRIDPTFHLRFEPTVFVGSKRFGANLNVGTRNSVAILVHDANDESGIKSAPVVESSNRPSDGRRQQNNYCQYNQNCLENSHVPPHMNALQLFWLY